MTRRPGFSIARPSNGIVLSQNNGALTGVIASWQYSTTTTAANPGDGYIRFNNVDPALATEIYISELDGQDNDLGSLLELFNGRNGLLQVESATRPNVVLFVEIETAVDETGWRTLTIVDQHGGTGAFADLETVWLGFSFFGIQGNDLEIDAEGTLAERDAYDGESLGFIYASTDGDGDTITGTVLFRKLAGAGNWSVPIPIQGEKGNTGETGATGDTGPQGDTGAAGADGTDGIDGTSLLTRVRVVDTTQADPGSAYEAGDTIDGVVLAENDIVLRATSGGDIEDGFYVVPASGGAARVAAFNSYDSMPGVYVSVMEGATNADTLWRCTSDLGGALDTDPVVFEEFEGGGGASGDTLVGENVLAPHEGLVVKYVSATTVDIDASAISVRNGAGQSAKLSSVDLTVDITTSGANGLDTGSEANSTWYHLWVIWDGSTIAGLLSTSATAPTLPGGYTHKGYVGAVYNGSGGDFRGFVQRGNEVTCPIGSALANGTATSYTSVSLATLIPATATVVKLVTQPSSSSGTNAITLFVAPTGSGTTASLGVGVYASVTTDGNGVAYGPLNVVLSVAQQVYYRVGGTNARTNLDVIGWVY